MKKIYILWLLLFACLSMANAETNSETKHFYTLNTRNGLSDNTVLQMLQLGDGRMVIATEKGINIYDRTKFDFLSIGDKDRQTINNYKGQTHLYVDSSQRLWVKTFKKVCCIDLRSFKIIRQNIASVLGLSPKTDISDVFVDNQQCVWIIEKNCVKSQNGNKTIMLPLRKGNLQDLLSAQDELYLFFSDGTVRVYNRRTMQFLYEAAAYPNQLSNRWSETSLVLKDKKNMMYQVRTGKGGSVFVTFNPQTHAFKTHFSCSYILHTLTLSPPNQAIISSPAGYLVFQMDANDKHPSVIKDLTLPDGTQLNTGVNTIYRDCQGGIWLGTYHRGLLYTSPYLGLFDTEPVEMPLFPILTRIYVEGVPVQQNQIYGKRILQPHTAAYTQRLTLEHNQAHVAFQFSTMNYVNPRQTLYRYRLNGERWNLVSADRTPDVVDGNGVLYLSFQNLSTGEYRLDVQASVCGKRWSEQSRTISFSIEPSPWQTPMAWTGYGCALLMVCGGTHILLLRNRKRKERVHALMKTIQELRNRCHELEKRREDAEVVVHEAEDKSKDEPSNELSDTARNFLELAISRIEANLSDSTYGVEQLAGDLCMERTGLYKKLKSFTGITPVTFIRSVRLQRAAELIVQKRMPLTDVAYATGFGSASYFAKCFKTEFGMSPSEYMQKKMEKVK